MRRYALMVYVSVHLIKLFAGKLARINSLIPATVENAGFLVLLGKYASMEIAYVQLATIAVEHAQTSLTVQTIVEGVIKPVTQVRSVTMTFVVGAISQTATAHA
ncbi:MAG: hypothetical protein LUQ38_05260 [Methanotrichaceae archaeon]|nr:hypothetical protein [Methanotrichaceae archaeon]